MNEQRLDHELDPIYNSSVPIQDVSWKTCWERWTIETSAERGSEKSVQIARYNDEDLYKNGFGIKNPANVDMP